MNKSWTSREQVVNKSWASREQVVNKLWISCEKLWTSYGKVINKFWTTSYKPWTSLEQVISHHYWNNEINLCLKLYFLHVYPIPMFFCNLHLNTKLISHLSHKFFLWITFFEEHHFTIIAKLSSSPIWTEICIISDNYHPHSPPPPTQDSSEQIT